MIKVKKTLECHKNSIPDTNFHMVRESYCFLTKRKYYLHDILYISFNLCNIYYNIIKKVYLNIFSSVYFSIKMVNHIKYDLYITH